MSSNPAPHARLPGLTNILTQSVLIGMPDRILPQVSAVLTLSRTTRTRGDGHRPRRAAAPPEPLSTSPAAEPLLQAVPAANRVLGRAPPGFDGPVRRRLLLIGVTQWHPVAALLQHRVQVLDAPKLIAQLGRADLDDQGRRIGVLVAPGLEVRLSGRRGQDPRILRGPRPGGAAAHCGAPFVADAGDYGSRYMTSRVVIRDYPWACARQPPRRPAGPAPGPGPDEH